MIREDNIQYSDLENNVPNSSLFKSYCKQCNINDIFTFLAFSSKMATHTLVTGFTNSSKDKNLLLDTCKNSIITLNKQIFLPLNYHNDSLVKHNKYFECFGKRDNPFQITSKQFNNYLDSNPLSPTETASIYPNDNQETITQIEQYLKTMFLCNRAAKLNIAFKEHDITNSVKEAIEKNPKKNINQKKLYYAYDNIYKQLYSDFTSGSSEQNTSYNKFMSLYTKFLAKKITRQDLENSPEYNFILRTISDTKNNKINNPSKQDGRLFYKLNQRDINITPDSFYRNAVFTNSISQLYSAKALLSKKSLVYYLSTIKKFETSDELSELEKELKINKFKSKFRITKYLDNEHREDDSDISQPKNDDVEDKDVFDTCLCFMFRGYNFPFKIHTTHHEIEKAEAKYGIELEEGDLDMQKFVINNDKDNIETYNSSLYFKPIFPYKYTNHQISNISELYNMELEKQRENEFNRSNDSKLSFLRYTMAMCEDLNDIILQNDSNVPSKSVKEISN